MLSVIKDNSSSFAEQKLLLDPILKSPKITNFAAELEVMLFKSSTK